MGPTLRDSNSSLCGVLFENYVFNKHWVILASVAPYLHFDLHQYNEIKVLPLLILTERT